MTSRCNHYSTICRYCNHYLWDLADSPRCFDCFVNHINYFLTINTGSYDVSIRRLHICRRWGGLAGHRRPHSLSSGSCGKRPSPECGRGRMAGPARQRRRRAARQPRRTARALRREPAVAERLRLTRAGRLPSFRRTARISPAGHSMQ